MKKKFLMTIMAATLSLGLIACGNTNAPSNEQMEIENNVTNEDVTPDIEAPVVDAPVVDTPDTEISETPTEGPVEIALSSLTILNDVWATYAEDEKPFIMGGDAANPVDGAPGNYDLSDLGGINAMFRIEAENIGLVDEAASMVHAMNTNTFTASAFHVTDEANVVAFVTDAKESIKATQWMCGIPEKLVMITVDGDYVVSAFGAADVIDNFSSKVINVYGETATVVVDEPIE